MYSSSAQPEKCDYRTAVIRNPPLQQITTCIGHRRSFGKQCQHTVCVNNDRRHTNHCQKRQKRLCNAPSRYVPVYSEIYDQKQPPGCHRMHRKRSGKLPRQQIPNCPAEPAARTRQPCHNYHWTECTENDSDRRIIQKQRQNRSPICPYVIPDPLPYESHPLLHLLTPAAFPALYCPLRSHAGYGSHPPEKTYRWHSAIHPDYSGLL